MRARFDTEAAFAWVRTMAPSSLSATPRARAMDLDPIGRTSCVPHPRPDPALVFYQVGWYDNILPARPGAADRMNLYVETGAPTGAVLAEADLLARVLGDQRRECIVTDRQLVAHPQVVLDPAYVHITQASLAETARLNAELTAHGVHSVGRYGGWTDCSIEDNLIKARALAQQL